MNNLASTYRKQGRLKEAEELLLVVMQTMIQHEIFSKLRVQLTQVSPSFGQLVEQMQTVRTRKLSNIENEL